MFYRLTVLRLLFVLTSISLCAVAVGSEVNKDVDDFNKISMSVSGDIELVQSDEHRVSLEVIKGKRDELEIDVRRGTLEIKRDCGFAKKCTRPHLEVEGTIYFQSINSMKMLGGGRMTAKDLTTPELEVSINGAGDIDIGAIESEHVDFKINGAGNVSVEQGEFDHFSTSINGAGDVAVEEGSTTSCEVKVNGSGDFSAIGLKSANAEVKVLGAGDVRVHASDELTITIMGAGDVMYDGDPQISTRILGSGKISKL